MKTITLTIRNLMLIALLPLLAACGDDVTNHNYPAPPPSEEEEEKPQEPSYTVGDWIEDAKSKCYFGVYPTDRYTLYPVWLLQADGVKRAYEESEFAQKYISDHIRLELRNPGAGTRVTLRMDESPISHASEESIEVPRSLTDETIALSYPVKWNVDALLAWHADKMVELTWTLLLDGKEVDKYTQSFNCRSLHSYTGGVDLISTRHAELINEIKQFDFGSYPVKESGEYLLLYTTPFVMGYVDEHSPMVEELKGEVTADGYFNILPGAAYSTPEELLATTAQAFTYLMMKHRVAYTISDSGGAQYIRTIDDIFRNRQGYCLELAIAFASWCLNQGLDASIEFVPGHAVNRVFDKEKNPYPVDMTLMASSAGTYPSFSNPPTLEDFDNADRYFIQVMKRSKEDDTNKYEPGRIEDPAQYETVDVKALRLYLPSFNIGDSYAHTRAALATDEGMEFE